jgi:hypothetical protein
LGLHVLLRFERRNRELTGDESGSIAKCRSYIEGSEEIGRRSFADS